MYSAALSQILTRTELQPYVKNPISTNILKCLYILFQVEDSNIYMNIPKVIIILEILSLNLQTYREPRIKIQKTHEFIFYTISQVKSSEGKPRLQSSELNRINILYSPIYCVQICRSSHMCFRLITPMMSQLNSYELLLHC